MAAPDALTSAQKSLLPAWLLASQANLAKLTVSHNATRKSLGQLRDSLGEFDAMVERQARPPTPDGDGGEEEEEEAARPESGPRSLPDDCASEVCGYCGSGDLLAYALASGACRAWLEAPALWREAHDRQRLGECWWLGVDLSLRDGVARQASLAGASLAFVTSFCASAKSRRRPGIAPRTYARRSREVSHPLALGANDVLARVHTLGVEGRRRALGALEALVLATAAPCAEVHAPLVAAGGVPLFVAFLANELGSLQDLAAAALANLAAAPSVADDVIATMAACGARKPLVALLSSPSARVTLHQASEPFAHLDRAGGRASARANALRDRETYCQSVGCKSAARALTNALLPEYALALPSDAAAAEGGAAPARSAFVDEWDFFSYHSSGSFKDRAAVLLSIGDGVVEGAGADTLGSFSIHGTCREDRGCLALYFSKTYGSGRVADVTRSGHVGHVLWSGSKAADGFFGVWEVTAGDTHFELRRGGTCRIVPAEEPATYGGVVAAYEPYVPGARGSVHFPAITR